MISIGAPCYYVQEIVAKWVNITIYGGLHTRPRTTAIPLFMGGQGEKMEKMVFDYYYGLESEQFAFYRIPKMLIKDERFSKLSSDAKILYGLMLDRMGLSRKNDWIDENDRVYIIYTIKQITEDLGCATEKATRILNELDVKTGIGLVEKKRRGQGLASIIYVKNFVGVSAIRQNDASSSNENDETPDEKEENKSEKQRESAEFRKSKIKNFDNRNSRISEIENQEFRKPKIKNFDNQTSKISETENQEFRKSKPIKTERNDTDLSDTNQSIYLSEKTEHLDGLMDDYHAQEKDLIKENIDYDALILEHEDDQDVIDEIVDIVVDACTTSAPEIKIGQEFKPQQSVRSRFEKLNYFTVEYILYSLSQNQKPVKNIKAYLLTTIYNATLTAKNYYAAAGRALWNEASPQYINTNP